MIPGSDSADTLDVVGRLAKRTWGIPTRGRRVRGESRHPVRGSQGRTPSVRTAGIDWMPLSGGSTTPGRGSMRRSRLSRPRIVEGVVVFRSLLDENPAVHQAFCPSRRPTSRRRNRASRGCCRRSRMRSRLLIFTGFIVVTARRSDQRSEGVECAAQGRGTSSTPPRDGHRP